MGCVEDTEELVGGTNSRAFQVRGTWGNDGGQPRAFNEKGDRTGKMEKKHLNLHSPKFFLCVKVGFGGGTRKKGPPGAKPVWGPGGEFKKKRACSHWGKGQSRAGQLKHIAIRKKDKGKRPFFGRWEKRKGKKSFFSGTRETGKRKTGRLE